MSSQETCPHCQTRYSPRESSGMCPRCLLAGARADAHPEPQGFGATRTFSGPARGQMAVPKPDQIGKLFPELEVLDVVGQGGMGMVYKARQKSLGREVAVKLLSRELQDDPNFAERFTREARAMALLNHPNIISIHDFGQRGDYHYLVMEFVDGVNLRQLLQAGRMEPAEAMLLVPQLCDALQYAHDNGIVHRDIKPENVLLSQNGHVKIADFGLAKLVDPARNDVTLTRTRQVMGTLSYMAPEQVERPADVDHRADIYSLGVVIYELLTGELPLGRFSPPSRKAEIDVRLDEIVLRALEKEPSLRYQQVSELKTGVGNLEESPLTRSPGGVRQEQQLAGKIARFIWLAVALTFCFVGGINLILASGTATQHVRGSLITAGVVLLAIGFLLFALIGVFTWVFREPNPSTRVRQPGASGPDGQAPAPGWLIALRVLGTGMFFLCGAFFVASIVLPRPEYRENMDEEIMRFLGVAAAIMGAFVLTVAGMLTRWRGHRDD